MIDFISLTNRMKSDGVKSCAGRLSNSIKKLSRIWSEDMHFTKQSVLPAYTNKKLNEIHIQNQIDHG